MGGGHVRGRPFVLGPAVITNNNAVKSVNPNIKGQSVDFAVARNDLQNAWKGLQKMYANETSPLEALIDLLQVEQHLEMIRLLASIHRRAPRGRTPTRSVSYAKVL